MTTAGAEMLHEEPDSSAESTGLGEKVAAVLSARLVVTSVDALTAIALVRLLARSELAVLSLVFVLYELVRQVAALGLPESVFYFLEREGKERTRSVVRRTLALLGVMAVVSAVALLGLVPFVPTLFASWSADSRAQLVAFLPVMAFVGLLELPSAATHNILVAVDRPKLAGAFNVVSSVATFVSLLGPAALGLGLPAIRVGFLVQAAVRALGTFVLLAYAVPRTHEPVDRSFGRKQLDFAFPLGLHALVTRLHRHLDKWIVASLLGEAATAAYAVATTEIPFVTALPYAVGAVFVTRYVGYAGRGDSESLVALFQRGIRKVSLAVIPVTTFAVVFADDLVRLAFGPDYSDVVWPFRLVALITLQRVAQYGVVLQAYGRTRYVLVITAVMLTANAVLVVPLATAFGLGGAASANLVASYVGFALYLVAIARSLGRPVLDVFPLGRIVRATLVCASIALAVLGLSKLLPDVPVALRFAFEAVTFLCAYVAVGVGTGAIEARDWHSLRLLFGRPNS